MVTKQWMVTKQVDISIPKNNSRLMTHFIWDKPGELAPELWEKLTQYTTHTVLKFL